MYKKYINTIYKNKNKKIIVNVTVNTSALTSGCKHTDTEIDNDVVKNFISQIKVGDTVYDIATHHGITFYNGSTDNTGTKWNGITEIDVVIPDIPDFVKDPIKFAGTVDDEDLHLTGGRESGNAEKGDLVYITKYCTFVGEVCEAGEYDVENGSVTIAANQIVTGVTIVVISTNN